MKNRTLSLVSLAMLAVITIATSCEKNNDFGGSPSSNPRVDKLDPAAGASNTVLQITGSGLGAIRKVYFDKDSVAASFNPAFNTNDALILRVPVDAVPGDQNIVLVNSLGKAVSVPFNVLGFVTISGVSNYDFTAGDQITLTGKNLADVSQVVFSGTDQEVEVASKSATSIVLKMPVGAPARSALDMTNQAGTITTTQEFVNLGDAYQVFTDDYQNGFENASWGPAAISNTVAKTGTASFAVTYKQGQWSADGVANWNGIDDLATQGYKYFTFWIKGGSENYTLYLMSDRAPGGYGNSTASNVNIPLAIPANTWTYFKFPLTTIKFWDQGGVMKQIGWWIQGPNDQDETFYLDDVLFVK